MATQFIYQNETLYDSLGVVEFGNVVILDYQTTRFDDTVLPINLFGTTQLNSIIYVDSIDSTSVLGATQFRYNQNLFLGDNIEALSIYPIQNYVSTTISEVIASLEYSIASNLAFGLNNVKFLINANSIEPEILFGNSLLSRNITLESISADVVFGNSQINMEIDNVPFPSIESTVVISQPSVRYVIGPLGIATTANFGTSNFIDNIHRLLVFKDDNISKVGDNDAVVVAGGIRINPSSAGSQTATSGNAVLPSNPVGFISVNIGGTDYLMPYYNA